MKPLIFSVFLFVFCSIIHGQSERVQGQVQTRDTANISIIKIFPDSFPAVGVVFRAENRSGQPIWGLTKEKMIVKEDNSQCCVRSLKQLSQNQPIDICLVMDHSGSMIFDPKELLDENDFPLFYDDGSGNFVFPDGYVTPLEKSKSAVKNFINSLNFQKDQLSLIGFSSKVDLAISLTRDVSLLNREIDKIQADSATAFYDALIAGLNSLKNGSGVKVLVALTDGMDNSSNSDINSVISLAKKERIPIFIIGLGEINDEVLRNIAERSKGQFFKANSSKSLDAIYSLISKKVQAYYVLTYDSENLSHNPGMRNIELSFLIDSMFVNLDTMSAYFPASVIPYLQDLHSVNNDYLFAGVTVLVLLSAGTLLFLYKRKKNNSPVIKNLYPNPSNGIVNLDLNVGLGSIQIFNNMGVVLKTVAVNSENMVLDLSDFDDGIYVAVLENEGKISNGYKFIIQH